VTERPNTFAWLAALGTLVGFAAACGPRTEGPPPSVLLITVDTLRPDYMSFNGYDRETTPAIDKLLAGGFYFDQAVAPVPRTTPSLAALLTGTYPHTNGVRRLTDRLDTAVGTLPEILRAADYQTLAVVTNQVLGRRRGLDRGFDVYDVAGDWRMAGETTDTAIEFFEGLRPGVPVFAWVHYIDPHAPYDSDPSIVEHFSPGYTGRYAARFGSNGQRGVPGSHQPYPEDLPKRIATHRNPLDSATNAHIRRLYAADIRSLDSEVGRLLDAARVRLGDRLIVVFTADHGESLGEHDFYFDHGDYVYDPSTRVPLAFVLPADHPVAGHGRCRGWVSLVDVAPTILELLGRPPAATPNTEMEGRSLTACMRGEAIEPLPVFSESGYSYYAPEVKRRVRNTVGGRFRSVVQDDWKLIFTPFAAESDAWEIYDLANDPGETRNLYRPDHPALERLKPAMEAFLARTHPDRPHAPISTEDADALRSLGYLDEPIPLTNPQE
jgi:arylsulfatase A-like enzyme